MMEKATGLNKFDLFLELRHRYNLICKDLDGNKEEYDDIKAISTINEIDIKFVEIEECIFSDEIIYNAIKKHYDHLIN